MWIFVVILSDKKGFSNQTVLIYLWGKIQCVDGPLDKQGFNRSVFFVLAIVWLVVLFLRSLDCFQIGNFWETFISLATWLNAWMGRWHKTGFNRSILQVFNRYSFSVCWWFGIWFIFDHSFSFLVPLSSLELYFINSILALWLLVFWFFGAPLVPFTCVSFVDTHLFVSTYALSSLRTLFWCARLSGW